MSQKKINNNPKSSDEDISFYHYSRFENVKLINKNIKNVYKAHIKKIVSRQGKTLVTLKYISLNNKFTLNNFINEVKRHRKLEKNDNILKFYGITKQETENTNSYMIVLEYANNGSLRQYFKKNFQKLDWNLKLNLAKQIANALMNLHDNNIIHGKLTSESIHIHNGTIKLNYFGINYLKSLTTDITIPIQYTDFRYLELFNKSLDIYSLGIILWEISSDGISPFEKELITKQSLSASSSSNNDIIDLINDIIMKGKREKTIPGIPPKYKEIYTDCLKRHGNSRPDIFEVVNNLSEINIISDINSKNDFDKLNEEEFQFNQLPINSIRTKTNNYNIIFIKKLFELFINILKVQFHEIQPIIIKNYIRGHDLNPVKILHEMIRYPSHYWFTSLIGFFYQHGIGTVTDDVMAFKFFSLAANNISASNSPSIRKLYHNNKEFGTISLANMYSDGLGVEKDAKKAFRIYYKLAGEGSLMALNNVAYCYDYGLGVEKDKEKAFELYLKSAEKGCLLAQFNVGWCYEHGTGITKDETKGFHFYLKSACAGNINAMCNVGYSYENGVGISKDEKEAFKWYMKAAEKELNMAQHNSGCCYIDGEGIEVDQLKAFEWFKKAAEKDYPDSQYLVGKYLYEGLGISKDIVKAIYWLSKAKENGNITANRLLDGVVDRIIFF
ncbi:hypothetical protein Glove_117g189 [Diversispora epigaea]|uniref:Protein kinase domain-containing protein n=1 Tax=Diversispora epigaea TaxID=1348612 RepID=A0A397J0F6_9GLOM|nr:hypothetical protein Glove_117g189 [Diversispora epigaea]